MSESMLAMKEITEILRTVTAERDRLKAELASETAWAKQYSDQSDALLLENNELRKALEQVDAEYGRLCKIDPYENYGYTLIKMIRAALEPKP